MHRQRMQRERRQRLAAADQVLEREAVTERARRVYRPSRLRLLEESRGERREVTRERLEQLGDRVREVFQGFACALAQVRVAQRVRAAIERGLRVYLITKTLEERNAGQRETSHGSESILGRWGVTVLHKFHMHEKLVFIDHDILWSGSLNALSFSDTQEVMERRVSREVVNDYADNRPPDGTAKEVFLARRANASRMIDATENASPTPIIAGTNT